MTLQEAIERYPPIWTMYQRPADRPYDEIVVRVWYGEEVCGGAEGFETYEQAKEYVLGNGASVCLGRYSDDDPVIIESWI